MGNGNWNPWRGMGEFRQQMEQFLDEHRAGVGQAAAGYAWTPLADVLETPQALIAMVELPGIPPEQVVVEIVEGDLIVRGERPFDPNACDESQDFAYHLLERGHGTFARRFALPPGVDGEGVSAKLIEGLLTITVPKLRPRTAPHFTLIAE